MSETSNPNPPGPVPIPIPLPPPLPFPFDRPFPILPPPPPHPHMFHPSLFVSHQPPCFYCGHRSPQPPIFAPVQYDNARVPEIPQAADGYADLAVVELGDENEEEEDVFVMTDEWVEFFAKSEANRKAEKKKQTKRRKKANSRHKQQSMERIKSD